MLHHGYIKMAIISQQFLSRFRDVKSFFSKGKRCNSWKHTIPSMSKRGDGDISISSIYYSQNTSQPNIIKK